MTDGGSRLARWRGLVGLAARRTVWRARETESRQTALSVAAVAVAVALVLVVSGVALDLATGSTVADATVDYWLVPEGAASSAVAAVEGQQLGRVHAASERIERIEGVDYATPVLPALLEVEDPDAPGGDSYVLALGFVPAEGQERLAGLSTDALARGDPYHAGGERTGEAVLSAGAAEALGVEAGDRVVATSGSSAANRTFVVVEASRSRGAGVGQLPVMLVHLSELQAVTGAADQDAATQILVGTSGGVDPARLDRVYPQSDVLTRSERRERQVARARLPLAVGAAALAVAVVVGTLFVATAQGFELAATRRERAVLAALGVSRRSVAALAGLQALVVSLLGGVAGVVLGALGIVVANAVSRTLGTGTVASFHPGFVLYGLAAALLVGLLALPYLLAVGYRTAGPERLREVG